MKYAAIRKMDISNGEGLGVSLFVQGCHFHCKNCFNKETWNFDGGNELTFKEIEELLHQLSKPQYTRLSILGGEPLAEENIDDVFVLCKFVKQFMPEKQIWVYSGYTIENMGFPNSHDIDQLKRFNVLYHTDVLVDGQYIDELKDMSYPWAGSTNQRVINVQESLKKNEVVLWRKS